MENSTKNDIMNLSAFLYVCISVICLCNSYVSYKGVLEQHQHHVTATHVRMVACAVTAGLTIFASAKALLLESTVPKVKIPFNVQDSFLVNMHLNFNSLYPMFSLFEQKCQRSLYCDSVGMTTLSMSSRSDTKETIC